MNSDVGTIEGKGQANSSSENQDMLFHDWPQEVTAAASGAWAVRGCYATSSLARNWGTWQLLSE